MKNIAKVNSSMKIIMFVGVTLLVACVETTEGNLKSFAEDFANLTDTITSLHRGNLSSMDTLLIKIEAFNQSSQVYGINRQFYENLYNVLGTFRNVSRQLKTTDRIMKDFVRLKRYIEKQFDLLNQMRERVSESQMPKWNVLLDDLFDIHADRFVEVFKNSSMKSKQLEDEVKNLINGSNKLIDALVDAFEECLEIPKTRKFSSAVKEVFQCRQGIEAILPSLEHNSAGIGNFVKCLEDIDDSSRNYLWEDLISAIRQLTDRLYDENQPRN